jgi:hypothetical protein
MFFGESKTEKHDLSNMVIAQTLNSNFLHRSMLTKWVGHNPTIYGSFDPFKINKAIYKVPVYQGIGTIPPCASCLVFISA